MKQIKTIATALLALLLTIGPGLLDDAAARERNMKLAGTCPNPSGTVKRSGGVRTFTLSHGQKGGCPTDRQARHNAPYWERTEVRSSFFKKGRTYRFSADIKFDPATRSSNRTTFFQIHQYNAKGCTGCGPAIMLKVKGNRIIASVHRANGYHTDHSLGVSRSQFAGAWTTFTIEMGTDNGTNRLVVSVNGKVLYRGQVYIHPKGTIYAKSGIYRPGSTTSRLPTDRLSMRKLRYEIVK